MSNKNKWIIGISVFAVVVLAAVLLFVMLGDIQPASGSGDGNTTQNTAGTVENEPSTDPSNTTDPSNNTDPSTTDPSTTTEPTTETTTPTTVPPTTEPQPSVEVDVDVDDEDEEDDKDSSNGGVIDFDDLIAAAGK